MINDVSSILKSKSFILFLRSQCYTTSILEIYSETFEPVHEISNN